MSADLKRALLQVARSPGFALVIIGLTAMGIGAAVAAFELADTLLIKPLPGIHDQHELVTIHRVQLAEPERLNYISNFDFKQCANEADILTDLAAFYELSCNLSDEGPAFYLQALLVSENYFSLLGIEAFRGRLFQAPEYPGGVSDEEPVVVISYDLWHHRYNGDPAVVGKVIKVNRMQATVIGVTPPGFRGLNYLRTPEVFIPLRLYTQVLNESMVSVLSVETQAWLDAVGRLAPGITLEEARVGIELATGRQAEGQAKSGWKIWLLPLKATAFGKSGSTLVKRYITGLMAMVILGLLFSYFSTANVIIARSLRRRREIAILLCLGASPRRVMYQLIMENLLLVLAGGILGLLVAWPCLSLLEHLRLPVAEAPIDLSFHLEVDLTTIMFVTAISLASAVFLCLAPLPGLFRGSVIAAIHGESTYTRVRFRSFGLRDLLVALQISMALALAIGTILVSSTLKNLVAIDSGFEHDRVLTASLDLNSVGYDGERAAAFHEELLRRLRLLPGVDSVGLVAAQPILGAQMTVGVDFSRVGMAIPETASAPPVQLVLVGGEYFEALGLEPRLGRVFSDRDNLAAPSVVVVNETLADRFWNSQNPVGHHVRINKSNDLFKVIGVVPRSKYFHLREDDVSIVFLYYQQFDRLRFGAMILPSMVLVVRSQGAGRMSVVPALRRSVQSLLPNLAVYDVTALGDRLAKGTAIERQAAAVIGFFAILTLGMTLVGLFGLLVRTIVEQSREMAIRIACGASPVAIARRIFARWAALNGVGTPVGLLVAAALAHQLSPRLFGVSVWDPFSWLVPVLGVSVMTLIVCWIAAERAAAFEPASVLREVG